MKVIKVIIGGTICACLIFSSCATIQENKSGVTGGAIGTAAGGAVGAGVGAIAGNTGLGAIIGAVVGGTAGALIGHKMDKQRKELEKIEGAQVESTNNGEAIKVTFESGILFQTNSYTLNNDSKNSLSRFAASLQNNPDTNVEIYGHTDNTGNDNINIPLSRNRAMSVHSYLIAQGVVQSRLASFGKGSNSPVASNDSPAGRAENRRVEIFILPNEKMVKEAHQGTLK
jgi:outer membrane protein OmpA-like peptidoglycan-associated protein